MLTIICRRCRAPIEAGLSDLLPKFERAAHVPCPACGASTPMSYAIGLVSVLASFVAVALVYVLVGSPLEASSGPVSPAVFVALLASGVIGMYLVQLLVSLLLHALLWRDRVHDQENRHL
jgi:hypothetical protein